MKFSIAKKTKQKNLMKFAVAKNSNEFSIVRILMSMQFSIAKKYDEIFYSKIF